jgi:calcineurin-like phosphoesterase family protein
MRPWDDVNEMDEEMVKRWNEVVKPEDKVYHLGDVVINRKALVLLSRLNGDKVLIRGNHDIFKVKDYLPYFRDVRGYHVLDRMIFSHIPIHPESKGKFTANVHGHLHYRKLEDPWYQCVCVEHTDYRPIELGELQKRVNG